MEKCEISTGLFVHSECPQVPVVTCSVCSKKACTAHSIIEEGVEYCIECYSRDKPVKWDRFLEKLDMSLNRNLDLWYYHSRGSYYKSGHYKAFNYRDFENFDERKLHGFDDEDSGSFFDS